MSERLPLPVEQTDKVLLISRWLYRIAVIQSELQMAQRWDRLEELREIYIGLSKYLVQIVAGTDDLDSLGWEQRLFSRLIKSAESIESHKLSVEDAVRAVIHDLSKDPS